MNNAMSAKLHKLPFCPECLVGRSKPCTNPNGTTRAPHRVRQLVVDGLVVVKRSRKWKAIAAAAKDSQARTANRENLGGGDSLS